METAAGIVIDSKDNLYLGNGASIYMVKINGNKIERIKYAGYSINSKYGIQDGPAATATLQDIHDIAIDKDDNIYITQHDSWIRDQMKDPNTYITDPYIKNVPRNKAARSYYFFRKITSAGMISTIKTPDGKYILANTVSGLVVDGNNLYYASQESRSIEKINLSTGSFSHVAGKPYKRQYCPVYITGDTSKAELFTPGNMIMGKDGALVYSDLRNHRITKVANGKVTTLAGNNIIDPCSQNIGGRAQEGHKDGKALSALFNFPIGLAYDSKGNLFIADRHNMCIRKLSPDGMVTSFTTFDRAMAMIATY
jgi:sugar lactone lactonase YvrE